MHRYAGRPALQAVLLLVLVLALGVGAPVTSAAFTATTSNSSTLTAANAFPVYPAKVATDGAAIAHRFEETMAATSGSAAADSAGASEPGTFNTSTNGPSTFWSFNEGAGTRTADGSGAVNTGTVGSGASWTTNGRVGGALSFDGTANGYVDGAAAAVRTDASFTVSAWVYLTAATLPTSNKAVLSQNGSAAPAFDLMYESSQRWKFYFMRSNSTGAGYDEAVSAANAVPQSWTHLVGVYDSAAAAGSQIKLYVNGGAATTAGRTTPWDAAGTLQAGRIRWGNSYGDYFPGVIDQVRTYQRALSTTEIAALYTTAGTQWPFTSVTGALTTAYRTDGNGTSTGTVGTAVTFTAGRDGPAATMASPGANSYVEGATSQINAASSFTVAAWVRLTSTGTNRSIVTQDGVAISNFFLKYNSGNNRFGLQYFSSDSTGATGTGAWDTDPAATDRWTHVVGIHDATAQNLRLYVDGTLRSTVNFSAPWTPITAGKLQIGRGRWNGGPGDYWAGSIDDVRTYPTALNADEITAIAGNLTAKRPGALQGTQQGQQASTAMAFVGTAGVYNNLAVANPTSFTVECWFKVGPEHSGPLIGFQSVATGPGGNYDRVLYLDTAGRLRFGLRPGAQVVLASPLAYNDGAWHYVAATLGPLGSALYADGLLVASDSNTGAQSYTGYWRIGNGSLSGWTDAPSTGLVGTLDEVAVYYSALTAQHASWHYHANH